MNDTSGKTLQIISTNPIHILLQDHNRVSNPFRIVNQHRAMSNLPDKYSEMTVFEVNVVETEYDPIVAE